MKSPSIFLRYFAIFIIPICYGSFYSVFKLLLDDFSVFWLCWMRMIIAFLVLFPFIRSWKQFDRSYILPSFLLAFVFFIGLIAQSISLQFVSAGTAGFVVVSFILLTPFFAWLVFRTPLNKKLLISIIIVLVGYVFMFFQPETLSFSFQIGELLNFVGAVVIALQIVLFEKFASRFDTLKITLAQFAWCSVFMTLTVIIQDDFIPVVDISGTNWLWLLYLGIVATVVPFLSQFWGQKKVPSVVTAIIISFEPIFAAIFGYLLLGEMFGKTFLIGGAFIFIGVLSSIFFSRPSTSSEDGVSIKTD
ncbi:MAG: DMT family transporter [Promethearchaeota archaeon]